MFLKRFTSALLLSLAHGMAGEMTIFATPFTIDKAFRASVLPAGGVELLPAGSSRLSHGTIRFLCPHGARVRKGDRLIEWEGAEIERKREDAKLSIPSKSIALAQAEQDLADLESTREIRLEALRTAARVAREENEYFTRTDRNVMARHADHDLERAKQHLAYQTEVLRQFETKRAPGPLASEVDPLTRLRYTHEVAAAQFALDMESLRHQRVHTILISREAVKKADAERDAFLALREAEQAIPRAIEAKKIEVEKLNIELQRERDDLSAWEKDLAALRVHAPSDGWFYHGRMENGRWYTEDSGTALAVGACLPLSRPWATWIPDRAARLLFAHVNGATARELTDHQPVLVTLPGREDIGISGVVESIASTPSPDGSHALVIHVNWPKDGIPAMGALVDVRCVVYHKEQAIAVPEQALSFGPDGCAVSVMRADGKTERRPVRRGRISGDLVEILGGIEAGQVILVP
jgi:HlyD family secretion protein